jgi:hypothetical protein
MATLWVCPRNYLSASLDRGPQTRAVPAEFFDLESLVKGRPIDLLKVDIEGAEFDFVDNYYGLLQRTQAVMIEVHEAPGQRKTSLYSQLNQAGLWLRGTPIENGEATLAMFQR